MAIRPTNTSSPPLQRLNLVILQNDRAKVKDHIMTEGAMELNTKELPDLIHRFGMSAK